MEKIIPSRDEFPWSYPINTRWMDNDQYGHVNNVTYYSYFDTAVNAYLIENCGLDTQVGSQIGYIVSSSCDYFAAVAYPETIEVGVAVEHLGTSSVTYRVAVFKQHWPKACAAGRMTHVFVDRQTEKPTPIKGSLRATLEKIMLS
jgi:acyl-CoA thioester hydrolase